MSKVFLDSVREAGDNYRKILPAILKVAHDVKPNIGALLTVKHFNRTEDNQNEQLVHDYYISWEGEDIRMITTLFVESKNDPTFKYKRVGTPRIDSRSYEEFVRDLKSTELIKVATKLAKYGL